MYCYILKTKIALITTHFVQYEMSSLQYEFDNYVVVTL